MAAPIRRDRNAQHQKCTDADEGVNAAGFIQHLLPDLRGEVRTLPGRPSRTANLREGACGLQGEKMAIHFISAVTRIIRILKMWSYFYVDSYF